MESAKESCCAQLNIGQENFHDSSKICENCETFVPLNFCKGFKSGILFLKYVLADIKQKMALINAFTIIYLQQEIFL